LQKALSKLLLFDRLEPAAQAKVVEHTWTRSVTAGEILIQEGETGLAATELYVVKSGTFEVGEDADCQGQLCSYPLVSACRNPGMLGARMVLCS
jgi:CRP-like cAMP-binding protein